MSENGYEDYVKAWGFLTLFQQTAFSTVPSQNLSFFTCVFTLIWGQMCPKTNVFTMFWGQIYQITEAGLEFMEIQS